jgi:antitoxin MazE
MAPDSSHFLTIQSRGLIALPRRIRERYRLDEPGAQLELVEREDGVLELRPHVPVPADQAWFWSERWQRMERELEAEYARGEGVRHDDSEGFLAFLEGIEPAGK